MRPFDDAILVQPQGLLCNDCDLIHKMGQLCTHDSTVLCIDYWGYDIISAQSILLGVFQSIPWLLCCPTVTQSSATVKVQDLSFRTNDYFPVF